MVTATERPIQPGDHVRVRRNAEYTPRLFVGRAGSVVKRQQLGGRWWLQLRFDDGARTWLPAERLEPVGGEA